MCFWLGYSCKYEFQLINNYIFYKGVIQLCYLMEHLSMSRVILSSLRWCRPNGPTHSGQNNSLRKHCRHHFQIWKSPSSYLYAGQGAALAKAKSVFKISPISFFFSKVCCIKTLVWCDFAIFLYITVIVETSSKTINSKVKTHIA